ncbi:flagellar M-ring protein FliF [Clostridiales bacterium COT073_COT-073]|nr:flagellar M-ring protein FliF [Clostridiales bacterium COT073_COT-073]
MPVFITRISEQITKTWNQFERKQKIQFIAILAVAVIAIVGLIIYLNRPQYILLERNMEPARVNSIKEVFDSENIRYTIENNATAIYVERSQRQNATLALQKAGILTADQIDYDKLFENSLTMTQEEKRLKQKLFLQSELEKSIELLEVVSDADVAIVMADQERTVLDDQTPASASIVLKLKDEITEKQVLGIVSLVAKYVKNLDKNHISIIDTSGRLLYDGDAVGTLNGMNGNTDYKMQQELLIQQKVRSILLSRGEYDDAFVSVDLKIDFSESTIVSEKYRPLEGTVKGIAAEEELRNVETSNTESANPVGTDANQEVPSTFLTPAGNSNSTSEESKTSYKIDSEKATIYRPNGSIDYKGSSIAVVLNKFKIYDQALLEKQGALAEISWEDFKDKNGVRRKLEVDPDIITLISGATNNIPSPAVLAYEVPKFVDKELTKNVIQDYILLGIILLMVILLAIAIFLSTKPTEVVKTEPELSVEELLVSTRTEEPKEPITEYKSEVRIQVEKFVDENPEAAATLLRNWLNDQWGG